VRLSKEVGKWYNKLPKSQQLIADNALHELATHGPALSMPYARKLGPDTWELRFPIGKEERRVTYTFSERDHAVTLTTFRKQRQRDQPQVSRAITEARRFRNDEHDYEVGLKKPHRAVQDPIERTSPWRRKP
jgi:hypothetical protein